MRLVTHTLVLVPIKAGGGESGFTGAVSSVNCSRARSHKNHGPRFRNGRRRRSLSLAVLLRLCRRRSLLFRRTVCTSNRPNASYRQWNERTRREESSVRRPNRNWRIQMEENRTLREKLLRPASESIGPL